MRIMVPLRSDEYIQPLIQAGADEFYLGFYDEAWEEKFGAYADINRMSGFGIHANPHSFVQALDAVRKVNAAGKRIFITLNANGYSEEQLEYMGNYFPKLKEAGVAGIIVPDMLLASVVQKYGIPAVASTMCAIYNEDIAAEYFDAGVKRMILPRDLSLDEIGKITDTLPDAEFEAFFMRNGCIFSDCYCLGMHRPECGATCAYVRYGQGGYESSWNTFENIHDTDVNDYLYKLFHQDACAMCALYRLEQAGISSLKIVGRADDIEGVCRDIALTRENLKTLQNCSSEYEFLKKMVLPDNFPQKCRMGLSCYYPEVRFGSKGGSHGF